MFPLVTAHSMRWGTTQRPSRWALPLVTFIRTSSRGSRRRVAAGHRQRARARRGGQVGGQRGQLAVGAGGQRPLQPLVQLVGRQPAVARRDPEQLDDRVAVGVRGPQLAAADGPGRDP